MLSGLSGPKKPYSAVTVHIERLTGEEYAENDLSGIVDLIEVIRIQDSGPTEAARAIRKKLKYGNLHRQLRALTILDGLIQNAGARFQRTFADEPLLERLRLMPRDDMVDADVRAKCNTLYRQWAAAYKTTPGLAPVASLYKQLPTTKKMQPSQSRVVRETEQEAQREIAASPPKPSASKPQPPVPSRPVQLGQTSSSSFFSRSKDKKKSKGHTSFNLEKEKGQLMETIAASSVASTNLINAIRLINRENQRVSENPEARNRFEQCKGLRRSILRYIQLVESEQYIGGLLSANDELVKALMSYEVMDKSIDDDSDSDVEYMASRARRMSGGKDVEQQLAGISLNAVAASPPTPPRAVAPPPKEESEEEEEDDDDDNPFADRNAVKTPHIEKTGMAWR
ncbi:hypothetical protein BT63DRAFT_423846 [Microthyrium microscopicum]|uniref:VHS domain-containing protein n=1 Tax=Microthyrium microscopicum TaxID=703497 RepID=A0A6A6UFJ6_9PEZI|nr:hypothetical protein BT63DRAFT_423846 [Microthyrium microscopicum]